jgi:hypothetical protein
VGPFASVTSAAGGNEVFCLVGAAFHDRLYVIAFEQNRFGWDRSAVDAAKFITLEDFKAYFFANWGAAAQCDRGLAIDQMQIRTNAGGKYVHYGRTNPGGKYVYRRIGSKFHTNPGGKYVYPGYSAWRPGR